MDTLLRVVGQVEELTMIRTLDRERREVESLQWANDLAPRQRETPEAALVEAKPGIGRQVRRRVRTRMGTSVL